MEHDQTSNVDCRPGSGKKHKTRIAQNYFCLLFVLSTILVNKDFQNVNSLEELVLS